MTNFTKSTFGLSIITIILVIGYYSITSTKDDAKLSTSAQHNDASKRGIKSLKQPPTQENRIEPVEQDTHANERFDEISHVLILQSLQKPDFGGNIGDHYSSQLAMAEAGSGEAAYELALLHRYCPFDEQLVRDPEAAKEAARLVRKEYLDQGMMTLDQAEQAKAGFQECLEMWSVATKRYEDWYKIAEESDFPLIELNKADVEKYKASISEMLGKSVATGNLHAMKRIAMFYKNTVRDETLTRTWELIQCQTHSGCDQERYERFLDSKYHQHEVDVIKSEVQRLSSLIENGEITTHEFKYRLDAGVEPFDIEKKFQALSDDEKSNIEENVKQLMEDAG